MLTKLYANTTVAAVEGVPGQAASHECAPQPDGDPGGAPGNTGGGGSCASIVMVCKHFHGVELCIPVCLD